MALHATASSGLSSTTSRCNRVKPFAASYTSVGVQRRPDAMMFGASSSVRVSQVLPARSPRAGVDRPSWICRVKTQSADLEVGMAAPNFELKEPLTGKTVKLSDFAGSPLLVMIICNHCPYVVHLKEAIVSLVKEYQAKGFKAVAISANSPITHPQDGPDKMAEDAQKYGYTFPYLFDETQDVAKAYNAACTPEFYVFTAEHKLAYHGQFDDSRPRGGSTAPVTGKDLRAAMDAVLAGQPAPRGRHSIGCNIKWAPGNEPAYFGAQVVKA